MLMNNLSVVLDQSERNTTNLLRKIMLNTRISIRFDATINIILSLRAAIILWMLHLALLSFLLFFLIIL